MTYVSQWSLILALSILLLPGCSPEQKTPVVVQADPASTVANNPGREPVKPDAPSTESVQPPVVADETESSTEPIQYRLLSWNVESEGADSGVIADELTALNANDHYDVFTLTEVLPGDFGRFRNALGKHYKYAYSKSGNNDRLEILYNEDKFELVRHFEIKEINILNRYRAPLVVHLKDRSSETEFLVMVNHLARGKAEIRQQQATQLVQWARDQTLPVFALGDYNFDFVFETRKGNRGFENMLRDNIWRWIEPAELIDTNWYDNPRDPDGKDDYPGSILDFAFVAGPAKDWTSVCNVIVREGDFPDDEKTSDHRPFELIISQND